MAGLSASGLKTQIRSYTEVDSNVLSDSVLENIILNADSHNFVLNMTSMGTADPARQYSMVVARTNHSSYVRGSIISNVNGVSGDSYFGVSGTVVPEPETYALIVGGLALGFVMLRRRIKG